MGRDKFCFLDLLEDKNRDFGGRVFDFSADLSVNNQRLGVRLEIKLKN